MLVLTRKYQEKIRIGDNITITVLRMKGKAVRLGIEAPMEVPVVRGELSFNGESDGLQETEAATVSMTIECEANDDAKAVSSGRTFGRIGEMTAPWPTKSRSRSVSPKESSKEPATVGFSRVSRDKVAGLLPQLAAGGAPLRAVMEKVSRS